MSFILLSFLMRKVLTTSEILEFCCILFYCCPTGSRVTSPCILFISRECIINHEEIYVSKIVGIILSGEIQCIMQASCFRIMWNTDLVNYIPNLLCSNVKGGHMVKKLRIFNFFDSNFHYQIGFSMKNALKWVQTSLV